MDALQMCDKKLREPMGQKYMGTRSIEDLSAEPEVTKQQSKESAAGANGLPALPPKSRDAEGNKSPTDKQKSVSDERIYVLYMYINICVFALVIFVVVNLVSEN